eukprot:scpid11649/ scgid31614/ Espin; Autosomal recessive deafness type 36 protein; Ectoplasmic specialization protein
MTKLACNAASRGDVTELQRMFKAGGPLHKRPSAGSDPETGETPLHAAARARRLDALKWLLAESGIDPQTRAKNGETAAHLAAFEGWLQGFEVIVEHDPQRRTLMVTDKDLQGLNPLHVAIIRGNEKIVQWIVENFSAERLRLSEKGSLAVHYAAAAGRMGILRLIAEHIGTNAANAADENNATPVYFAAQDGQLEAIKYLVTECGADPKGRTSDGMQPLHAATQNGHEEVVHWLVARIGKTALMETTDDGATAIHFAAAAGHVGLLRWFFSTPNGSSLALVKDSMHSTPLHDAIDYGHLDCLKLILRHGGDLFASDLDGISPYSLAMECAAEDMGDYIMKYIKDKRLTIPAMAKKPGSSSSSQSAHVIHPTIPRSTAEEGDGDDHPIIPKGSGFPGGSGKGIRTLTTITAEIQAAQQEVMAHRLTSVKEAGSGPPVTDNRTRPMRQTSFKDLRPAAAFVPEAPPAPPPDLLADTVEGTEENGPSHHREQSQDHADSRPSPDGEEKGPLSQEVNDWFTSPAAEEEAAKNIAAESDTMPAEGNGGLAWQSEDGSGNAPATPSGHGEQRRARGGGGRSKRRKLQQQVPHYEYMPVYQPVMTPYGYMLAQTVMPMPVAKDARRSSARGKSPGGFNRTKSPKSAGGSGPGSPSDSAASSDSGIVPPERRKVQRKDSGRLPLFATGVTPNSMAAMKSLASVNETFLEEDEEEENEDTGTTVGGAFQTPSKESSMQRQRRQSLNHLSHSLTAMNTLEKSPMGAVPLSPFSPYAAQQQAMMASQQQQQQLSPAKQVGFVRWLFNRPASTPKGLGTSQSSTSVGDYGMMGRRGSVGASPMKSSRSRSVSTGTLLMGNNDFMIGLDEQSYQHGSTLIAMALCTSVIGMSIVSAVPRKSIMPMLANAAQRAVANFSLGGGSAATAKEKAKSRENRTTVETTDGSTTTVVQRAPKGDEQAKGAGGNAARPVSRRISIKRASSSPELLDPDAKDAQQSSVWEFDQKMESKASARWGSEESAPLDLDKIASLNRQGPKRETEEDVRREEKKKQEAKEEAERERLKAEEELERREEEKAIREAAKRAKKDEEKRKKEQKEEDVRRKKSEGRQQKEEDQKKKQQELMQRKQSKQDLKLGEEQRKKELAEQKANEEKEKKQRVLEEKETEKQKKLDEKKRKEEEKQRKKEADKEEKKRLADEKKRKKEEERLQKENEVRKRKVSKDEAKKKKRQSAMSSESANAERTEEFLGQWESDIKMQTGDLTAVLDDLQATIDLDGDIAAMYTGAGGGGKAKRPEEDTGVSELALALQLSGQAEVLSETMVYDERESEGAVAWQSSAAFDTSAAAAILSSDAALDEVTRRPSLASVGESAQPSRGQLGHTEPISEAAADPDDADLASFAAAVPPPPAAPPNLLGMGQEDQVGFLETTPSTSIAQKRQSWQQRSQSTEKDSGISLSSSSTALHSLLSNSKTDLSGIGRPGSAGSRDSAGDGSAAASAANAGGSELENVLNQRRKKAQNAFLSNYRRSVDQPM